MKKLICAVLPVLFGYMLAAQPCDSIEGMERVYGNDYEFSLLAGGKLWPRFNQVLLTPAMHEIFGYEFPMNSGKALLRNGGLLITAKSQAMHPVAATAASRADEFAGSDYYPGPLDENGNIVNDNCNRYDLLWRVKQDDIEEHKKYAQQYNVSSGGRIPVQLIPGGIRRWPAGNNPFAVDARGEPMLVDQLPWVDYDDDGKYDPQKGDYPEIKGSESVWTIYNSAHQPHKTTDGPPVSLEVMQQVYRYDHSGILGNTSFYHFKIENKGLALDSAYIGLQLLRVKPLLQNVRHDTTRKSLFFAPPTVVNSTYPVVAVTRLQGLKKYVYSGGAIVDSVSVQSSNLVNAGYQLSDSAIFERAARGKGKLTPGTCHNVKTLQFVTGPVTILPGKPINLVYAVSTGFCPSSTAPCPDNDCLVAGVDTIIHEFSGHWPTGRKSITDEHRDYMVFPNPAEDKIQIAINNQNRHFSGKATLWSTEGRLVKSVDITGNSPVVDVRHLPAGIYFLRLQSNEMHFPTRKIVIVK
jgi:hypothetical protein